MEKLPIRRIGMIGFGEAGQVIGRDLATLGIDVCAFDILMNSKRDCDAMQQRMSQTNVRAATSLRDVFAEAELIISLVTATAAPRVALEAATLLRRGQIFMDANSVSPESKQKMKEHFASLGDDFVEAAVVAPVPPHGLSVPILLCGVRAQELASKLQMIGMDATVVSDRIGVASAIKMCRSVIMKGLNALVIESLVSARAYGVEDAVLASLDETFPTMGWSGRLADKMIFRAAEHSRRRAAEMREVSQTLTSVGIAPHMASATAEVQEWLTSQIEEGELTIGSYSTFSWREFVDAIEAEKAENRTD